MTSSHINSVPGPGHQSATMGTLVLVLASLLAGAAAQGTCQSDRECDEPLPCCSG